MIGEGFERDTTAAESALLDRVDAELQESLDVRPSRAFLPAVRRRVAEVKAGRDRERRWGWVPALASLACVLIVGHFVRQATRAPGTLVSAPAPPAETRALPPFESGEAVMARAPEVALDPTTREVAVDGNQVVAPQPPQRDAETAPMPRVVVPPEDAEVVRRLARRLRGHAARTAVMGPDVEGPYDFTLKPIEGQQEVVTIDHRVGWESEPGFAEPASFDRTVEKAGRET
jgi:hypothetical protein